MLLRLTRSCPAALASGGPVVYNSVETPLQAGRGVRAVKGPSERGAVRVAAYLRVSTDGQEKHGAGLEAQQQAIERHCREQGWEIAGTYRDVVSGAEVGDDLKVPRPGLERMLADAPGLGIQYVVVYDSSRLARSTLVQALVEHMVLRAKLDVRSATEPSYTLRGDETSALLKDVLAAAAKFERAKIARRTFAGRVAAARRGQFPGGGVPYGYTNARGSRALEVHEREAGAVRLVFKLRRRLSPHAVAKRLNERGVPTRKGTPWTQAHVLAILRRRAFYEGRPHRYGGAEVQGRHEPILRGRVE